MSFSCPSMTSSEPGIERPFRRVAGLERQKILIDATNDRILGFTMVGASAGEVMATVQLAMFTGAPYTPLRHAIFTHPTMPEGLLSLLLAVPPKSQ